MKRAALWVFVWILALGPSVQSSMAGIPGLLGYQGRVIVNGTNYTGTGQFTFALVDAGTNTARRAMATAVVNSGYITSYVIIDGGTSYTVAPAVQITDPTGSNATALAWVGGGAVTNITVGNVGGGYSGSPTVTIDLPPVNMVYGTYWSNGASTVSIPVNQGLYSLLLGDTNTPGMAAIPVALFTNTDVRLRVWFNGGSGLQQLSPDQRIAAVGYALNAQTAQGVSAGAITAPMIANSAVGTAQLATGAVISAAIADGTVSNVDLANGAVTAVKLADGTTLTEISDNDGTGSGLDADLLDGLHGNAYQVKVASSQSSETTWLVTTNIVYNYAGGQVTITAPQSGTVIVEANAWMKLGHVNGTQDFLQLVIGTTTNDMIGNAWDTVSWTVPSAYPTTSGEHCTFTVRRMFAVTAGTYTYYLNGVMWYGANNDDAFWFSSMHAIFYPQ